MPDRYTSELTYRRLDERGDMVMGTGHDFLTGREAIAQSIQTRLKLYEDEWWEYDDGGLPMFTEILGLARTEANRAAIDRMIVARIADTVGVVAVRDYQSRYDGRKYLFSCAVETQYGDVQIGGDF